MKRLKAVIYGEPGVGKSVFAAGAPKPFFITTDGNYEWLEEFGADPEAHIQVNSWAEAKKAFTMDFSKYETIVIDLTEDLFKWCEHEYCVKNRLEHVSDIGYGKGYDTTRNEFFLEMCKLIGLDKHIIFIMHGVTYTVKDRRGVEHTKYGPTTRIPDKVLDMIEGRVRYFLRCYLKSEEDTDKKLVKRRYLSLVPKENEFGIIRGIDENTIPHDIPLDFKTFAEIIGLNSTPTTSVTIKETEIKKVEEVDDIPSISEADQTHLQVVDEVKIETDNNVVAQQIPMVFETEPVKEEVKTEEVKTEVKEEVKTEVKQEVSNDDKLAAIKAKLAALKAEE